MTENGVGESLLSTAIGNGGSGRARSRIKMKKRDEGGKEKLSADSTITSSYKFGGYSKRKIIAKGLEVSSPQRIENLKAIMALNIEEEIRLFLKCPMEVCNN